MKMNVQDGANQVRRLIKEIGDKARDYLADSSETTGPTAGELWDRVSPRVEKALTIYGKMESPSTRDSTWIPFVDSKENCQKELDEILDLGDALARQGLDLLHQGLGIRHGDHPMPSFEVARPMHAEECDTKSTCMSIDGFQEEHQRLRGNER